jgi:hypothetical protein
MAVMQSEVNFATSDYAFLYSGGVWSRGGQVTYQDLPSLSIACPLVNYCVAVGDLGSVYTYQSTDSDLAWRTLRHGS